MILDLLPALAISLLAVGYALWRRHKLSDEGSKWEQVAAQLGLSLKHAWPSGYKLAGRLDGLAIQVRVAEERGAHGIELTIDAGGRIPRSLRIGAENSMSRAVMTDLKVGDRAFDDAVRLSGPEPVLLAVLDAETRKLVMDNVVKKAVVQKGLIKTLADKPETLVTAVPELIRTAQHLMITEDEVADRLAVNATNDPLVSVRLQNLRELVRRYSQGDLSEARSKTLFRSLLESDDPELRFEAATALGDEGIGVVCELATHRHAPDRIRVRAISYLLEQPSNRQQAIAVLETIVTSSGQPRPVLRFVVTALGKLRHTPALGWLHELAQEPDPYLSEVVATALGEIADPSSEQHLFALLQHADTKTWSAVVQALRQVGTVDAIEPLRLVVKQGVDRALRKQIEATITTIQARLIGAEQGQLSVAATPDHKGALSPSTEPGDGALTLTER